jgi:hypothetical protein
LPSFAKLVFHLRALRGSLFAFAFAFAFGFWLFATPYSLLALLLAFAFSILYPLSTALRPTMPDTSIFIIAALIFLAIFVLVLIAKTYYTVRTATAGVVERFG